MTRRTPHDPRWCTLVPGSYMEHGRSTASEYVKSQKLRCPACDREMRQNLNYLGRDGKLMCVGSKFVFPHQQTLDLAVRATDAEAP